MKRLLTAAEMRRVLTSLSAESPTLPTFKQSQTLETNRHRVALTLVMQHTTLLHSNIPLQNETQQFSQVYSINNNIS